MPLDIFDISLPELDLHSTPFEGVPNFSEAQFITPIEIPVTGERSDHSDNQRATHPTQSDLSYWDFELGVYRPAPPNLIFKPCSPPSSHEMSQNAPTARHGTGGFLPPMMTGPAQGALHHPPTAIASVDGSAILDDRRKRKISSDDEMIAERDASSDDNDSSHPQRPSAKRQRVLYPQPEAQSSGYQQAPESSQLAPEVGRSSTAAARQAYKTLKDERRVWRKRQLRALREAENCREKQVEALQLADYYGRRWRGFEE